MDKHFPREWHLSLAQSAWAQFAHYLGYFLMALPAGWLAMRLGYKGGIIAPSCNGIGWILGPIAGGMFFYGKDAAGRSTGSEPLWIPDAAVAVVVLVLAGVFFIVGVPDIKSEDQYLLEDPAAPKHSRWKPPHFTFAVLAPFRSVAGVFLSYFFMSSMFPTIIHGFRARAKQASAFIVMAILGGAVLPKLLGWVGDRYGLSRSFAVPMVCFAAVSGDGFDWRRLSRSEAVVGIATARGH